DEHKFHLEPVMPDSPASSREERRGPSSKSGTPTEVYVPMDDIDEFQLYQRFRLKMVSTFGSIASALFEFGADHETGRISQQQFVHVACGQLQLLRAQEANSLFTHFTNADPLDQGVGGTASYRDFSISDEEWGFTVQRKKEAQQNKSTATPFSNVPGGGSAGIFHRNITIHSSRDASEQSLKGKRQDTPRSEGGLTGGESLAESRRTLSPGQSSSKRNYPWRQKQKPWAPSVFAGSGVIAEANNVTRFRP
ncbi:unnamed protein product, partial [Polarella glacialis]